VTASFLLRFLGLREAERPAAGVSTDSDAVRRIAARLESLAPERARFVAAFAYVLARVANADLRIHATESAAMDEALARVAGLDPGESALAVEIAKSQARLLGGTENYLATREFRRVSGRDERAKLVECLFAVAAADGSISREENDEILRVAEELGFLRREALALRAPWRDRVAGLRDLPGASR
jgi:uncharacterized tellurite resistance protein B-like protein